MKREHWLFLGLLAAACLLGYVAAVSGLTRWQAIAAMTPFSVIIALLVARWSRQRRHNAGSE